MRQKRLLKLVVLLLTAAVFSAPVSAADSGAGTMLQSHHTVIAPGFASYVRTYSGDQGQRQRGVSLELAPDSSVYPIVMACDTIWGGMTMDTAVRYAQMQGRRVVAAVNTAFYNSPGVPIGLVVEDGRLRSAAEGLNAFAILPDGSYYTAKAPKVYFELSSPAWGTEVLESRRLNKLFEREQLNIYTEDYSTVSTRVEEDAWAVRMAMDGAIGLEGSVTLTVTEVLPQTRAVPIGPGNLILTAGTSGTYAELFRRFQVGDTITMTTHCPDATLRQARYVTGCGDILVENGVITKEEEWMQTIAGQHPRSLLGWRRDGTLVVYTADGRDPGTADGLSLRMAAEELLRQGCVYGVNLDGGGSAVLGAQLPGRSGVEVLNRPSDGGQRQCAAYLLLVTDQTPDGVARYWHLDQNQRMVLPGQKLPLTVFGTDRALGPAGDPNQPLCFASAQGVLKENLYVAPQTGGAQRITVWGNNASGEGEIQVIANPSYLKILRKNGRPLERISLEPGQALELQVAASYRGQPIPADTTAIRYDMSTPLGRVDESGVFVADALVGTVGTLRMQIGSYCQEVQITVVPPQRDASGLRMKTALEYPVPRG